MRAVAAAPWALECEGKGGRSSASRVYVHILPYRAVVQAKSGNSASFLWQKVYTVIVQVLGFQVHWAKTKLGFPASGAFASVFCEWKAAK